MTNLSPNEAENSNGLNGSARAMAAIVVVLIALFGVLVILDVIALDSAGEFFKKAALLTLIVALAGAAIAFLLKSGKR